MNEKEHQLTSQEEAKRSLSVDAESVIEPQDAAPVEEEGHERLKVDEATAKKIVLERGRIYTRTELNAMGVIIVRKKNNRAVLQKEVDKKKNSIKAIGGIISPLTIMPVGDSLDIEHLDGTEIKPDDPQRPRMYMLVEGQHRNMAIYQLNKDGGKYETYFTLPLCHASPNDILREANTTNYEWDGTSWLSSALSVAKDKQIEVPGLLWLQTLSESKNISESAASLYVTGDRIISKAKLKDAVQKAYSGNAFALRDLVKTDTLENRKKMFESISAKFKDEKVIGLKVFPKTIYGFVKQQTDGGNITGNTAMDHVESFVKSLTPTQVKTLAEAKADKNKGLTKDAVIRDLLTTMWDKYQTKA